ncbi:RNA methyltransferase [Geomesophilobacter sediminis]|uniref:tRNA (cytidine/uridine-2'-O-)-methyltransferase TrmJ n=1 Tax=Geomesophilobacter sediminis TaxID=2798584 RepID=A0A8J7S9G8_9BACT|nr:RNA methyltransferase [Geomesophilobacter sediminis]MBJ6726790.1 RNA methyltransferase [Geomesophilobacter sediminis]
MELKDKVCIVLVGTQSPGNIGMVCRAMKNMGLYDLRLVNPCRVDHPDAPMFAVSAKDVLESAKIFTSLEDALADCEYSVATTRRHGKYRNEISTPSDIVKRFATCSATSRVGLVFGREDSGLTTDEVAICRWQSTIPTADEYGSLNLSQAVLIFCYEFLMGYTPAAPSELRELAGTKSLEPFYDHLERTLLRIGYLNPQNPDHMMRTMRRIFARAELDEREVSSLRGMLSQIDWAAAEFKGKKGK